MPFYNLRKKNAGVNSLPIRREDANTTNVVSSLSTEEEESTLGSFIEITNLESRDMFLKRKELSEDLDFEITKKPKTIIGFFINVLFAFNNNNLFIYYISQL